MNYYSHNNMFSKYELSSYLDRARLDVSYFINNRIDVEKIIDTDEETLIKDLVANYTKHAPVLLVDDKKTSAQESNITITNNDSPFNDGPFIVKGLKILVRIPFDGMGELFDFRPSSYILSGTPRASVEGNNLVLEYETREKDPEKIKQLLNADISIINDYLGRINRDLENFNNSLEGFIRPLVIKRKQEANSNKSLIDALSS